MTTQLESALTKTCTRCNKEHTGETKWCEHCKEVKRNRCKETVREQGRKYYRANAAKICARSRAWYKKNCSRSIARKSQWRDKYRERERERTRKRKYGMEFGTYARMLEAQGGVCAIPTCSAPPVGERPLSIDHDHKTGKIRALLCNHCNSAIGHLRESPEVAESISAYLREHQEQL